MKNIVWYKSRHSNPDGCCVEIANLEFEYIGIRDSKDSNSHILIISRDNFIQFISGLK